PRQRRLLILADTGGSNAYRTWTWKANLQRQLCNPFGLTVTVAHYPTGASKWNPIEHRLFSEISKHWAAEPLTSYQKILAFIRNTRTKTGLRVRARLDRARYPTKVRSPAIPITVSRVLAKWNYTIRPESA